VDLNTALSPEQRIANLEQLIASLAAGKSTNKPPSRWQRIDKPSLVLRASGAAILLLAAFGALMGPRNSAGSMSLVAGNPVIVGTTVADTWANSTMTDFQVEFSDSLSRSAKGGMLSNLQLADGTVNVPGLDFVSEAGSGLRRAAVNDLRLVVNQLDVGQWTANGYRTAAGAVATPSFSWIAETGTGWYRAGAGDIRFAVSGADKQFLSATGLGIGAAPTFPLDVATFVGKTHARFGVNTANPLFVTSGSTSGIGLGYNLQHNGTNWLYDTTATGAIAVWDTSANSLDMYTAPSGTAGNAATLTKRTSTNANGFTIGASGTAISASIRGTASLTGGSISANSVQTINITVTGAAVGAECSTGYSAVQSLSLIPSCRVTGSGVCIFAFSNYTTGAISSVNDTVSCRVWNP